MAVTITVSVDEKTVERAREIARQHGTSLNALIREYLEQLSGARSGAELLRDFQRHWAEGAGHSGGRPLRREDLYSVPRRVDPSGHA